jgi:hypothetical protein
MKRSTESQLKIFATIFIVLILVIYVLFNSRLLIAGPKIEVSGPLNGSSFDEPLIHITGKVKNSTFTSLDDNTLFIDEQGNFGQKLLLSPGLSIIKLIARDRFGREVQEILEYVYTGETVEASKESLELLEVEVSTTTEEVATSSKPE